MGATVQATENNMVANPNINQHLFNTQPTKEHLNQYMQQDGIDRRHSKSLMNMRMKEYN
jgi:hypothetical protein